MTKKAPPLCVRSEKNRLTSGYTVYITGSTTTRRKNLYLKMLEAAGDFRFNLLDDMVVLQVTTSALKTIKVQFVTYFLED